MTKQYRIAVIPGDGIGKEVVPEGLRVLDAVATMEGIHFAYDHFPWGCDYYEHTGKMMPDDGLDQIRHHDAILLGAVGFPTVPDHVSLWGLLIPIRRNFQQYVNLRPIRLMPGVRSPLANREVGDIDFYIVRENNEGDVVVGSNLFGDILSDLGPAITGTIGIAPSANLNPERNYPFVTFTFPADLSPDGGGL